MSTFTQEQEAILNGGDTSGKTGGTFDRLLKQESGGRQFNTNGGVVTSKKGAIGIAQVMPATGPEAAKLAGEAFDGYIADPVVGFFKDSAAKARAE